MLAQQLVRDGDLGSALKELEGLVRKDPSSPKLRVFLFQLLCVLGDWPRALTQLNVAAELDASTLPMAQTYRQAIQCEALRADIFKGTRAPLIFGEPPAWLAQLLQALQHDADNPGLAAAMRAQAFEAAPASAGSINGERFAWLADADPRLGPVVEAIVNGRYFWIPMQRIGRIELEPPADLRDSVWTPASFTWANGAQTVGLIPTRYNDTATGGDDGLRMGRRTEWVADGPLAGHGLGQRMLVTDAGEFALMEVRSIAFDALEELESAAGAATGSAQHG
jgi:type VI secretion system protein ImpE